ncbi:ABC transporter substrate-binding protein [Pseudomonas rubra]|uniref:Extracellular solute-binding protein n=1 Tax=Pseudomonas rubra TaxID=2942627 RepID=A0ABT5PA86_9PSED|nr:extracellular solute-binding protein [Pseudomonas rubra]MDD1015225.1 extracellular solute-binding protein [Pseudomonas rubra]MDD1037879.1 extracellular solute-binding protein [Pseudomonas rubra]MDD1152793.1 extracellular solute-binding protein [Pseudomonas rubra]
MYRCKAWLLALALGAASVQAAAPQPVVVLTSYPQEMMTRFEEAFERANPQYRLQILWRQGFDALPYLRQVDQGGVDVYWAPSPSNFQRLAQDAGWQPLGVDLDGLPPHIGGIALRDHDARYQATELAGYGFAINPDELTKLGMPAPQDWPDLLDARLRGRIALPDPARVGFAPVLLDIVLQAYGWDKGWALWSEIAGQSRLVERGGTLVSDEVVSGRSAVGVSIDFFVASAVSNGEAVEFVYPAHGGLNPAHIAIPRQAGQVEGARAFVRFVLSPEGQTLLADPDIRKLPVRPAVYTNLPAGYHDPFAAARQGAYAYANDSSRERLALITSVFDQWLGQPHERLRALWARVHAGEAQGRDLTTVRECLSVAPIDEQHAASASLLALFGQRQDQGMLRQPVSDQDALGRTEIAWQFHSARQQAQAERLLADMGL